MGFKLVNSTSQFKFVHRGHVSKAKLSFTHMWIPNLTNAEEWSTRSGHILAWKNTASGSQPSGCPGEDDMHHTSKECCTLSFCCLSFARRAVLLRWRNADPAHSHSAAVGHCVLSKPREDPRCVDLILSEQIKDLFVHCLFDSWIYININF